MHMDDVGADRHVDGHRNPQAMRGHGETSIRMWRVALGEERRDRLTEALPALGSETNRVVQQDARLLGHPEAARPKRFLHVLGRGAGERDFEVVDDAGAVERHRRHETAAHQLDQHRRHAGLDDVGTKAPDDAAIAGPRVDYRLRNAP